MPAPAVRRTGMRAVGPVIPMARLGGRTEPAPGMRFVDPTSATAVGIVGQFNSLTALTVEAYICPLRPDPNTTPFIVRYRSGTNGFDLRLDQSTNVLDLIIANGTTSTFCTSSIPPVIGAWQHIAGTYDGTTMRIFLGGVLLGTTALAGANTGNPGISLNIGSSFIGGTNAFHGLMQEMRVSKIARYTASFTPPDRPFLPDSNTLGLWHMNEGSGTRLLDVSGNAAHATFGGTQYPTWGPGYF